jgi:hypothetical protein
VQVVSTYLAKVKPSVQTLVLKKKKKSTFVYLFPSVNHELPKQQVLVTLYLEPGQV